MCRRANSSLSWNPFLSNLLLCFHWFPKRQKSEGQPDLGDTLAPSQGWPLKMSFFRSLPPDQGGAHLPHSLLVSRAGRYHLEKIVPKAVGSFMGKRQSLELGPEIYRKSRQYSQNRYSSAELACASQQRSTWILCWLQFLMTFKGSPWKVDWKVTREWVTVFNLWFNSFHCFGAQWEVVLLNILITEKLKIKCWVLASIFARQN